MKRLVTIALVLALTVPLAAQQYSYLAFEQITVAGTAIGFTAATINIGAGHMQAETAICRLETAQIRFAYDGTTPTTTVGTLWEVGEERQFNGHQILRNFRAIRTGGSSGQLDCTYSTP